jgi:hypothetical protein
MVRFETIIKKFAQKGEKTGWTYFDVPADLAQKLKPGNRREFKVKGKLDAHPVNRISLLPMGGGDFIFVLNASLRKALGKRVGAMLKVSLEEDKSPFMFNQDFLTCLDDEPGAKEFFFSLTGSHQRYFSKWIDDAKTDITRANRIAKAVNALARKMGYPEMLREGKKSI